MVKLLDSVVIFLEGGTDFDLEILDQEQTEKAEEKIKVDENKDKEAGGEKTIAAEVKNAEEANSSVATWQYNIPFKIFEELQMRYYASLQLKGL